MQSVISAIIALGALIFIHELGHFIFAKWFGVGVDKFSLGFGPKLIGKKVGETEYLISAFPLGGYVKMVGEGEDAELADTDKARSFAGKPPLQRIVIVAAGPVFNLFFAYLIFIVVYMIGVPAATTRIGEVVKDKPAARAGIQPKDLVTAINGKLVNRWEDLSGTIVESKGQPVELQVQRGKETLTFRVTPEKRTAKNLLGDVVTTPVLGIVSAGEIVIDHFGPVEAFVKGSIQTWNVIEITVLSLVKLVERAIPLETIGGPIMIVKMAGQQAAEGSVSFLAFVALLSINLGILNLLPVPILDGGHLFFYFWELVFRKPISAKAREIAQQVGLVLLIGLMVLAFYNDIARYFMAQNQ
ncbi:RIP metalloprotease RseP [Geotalea sp. SG265]|uniref:RIP metalloprotease RseP n=1 Tax=Geotalea sp. SG265 TaxID=2922867 RepID=UPI001FAFB5C5|nr:RIP metalloprotease RseP [Geotalea sp. SG265]